jgi:hypothetical protein
MLMPKRKYQVQTRDHLDDVLIYRTNDRGRAEEFAAIMSQDLQDVELVEAEDWPGDGSSEAGDVVRDQQTLGSPPF